MMRRTAARRRERIHFSLSIARLLILILGMATASCDAPQTSIAAPAGWIVFSSASPDQNARYCANWSKREWNVAADGDAVAISQHNSRGGRPLAVIPFRGGWLTGSDRGEWGGELSWSNHDRTRTSTLAEENIVGFVETEFGTLALAGLDHLGLSRGMVLSISREGPLPPSATFYAPLDGAPYGFTKDLSGNVIVVTTKGIVRVKSKGEVQKLSAANYGSLYPGSVAITSSGVIYVGMRHFVTRLTPANGSYREDWLVPADCAKFRWTGSDCQCTGG